MLAKLASLTELLGEKVEQGQLSVGQEKPLDVASA
jgi:hypothetical protein